jgi:hypothetical protein
MLRIACTATGRIPVRLLPFSGLHKDERLAHLTRFIFQSTHLFLYIRGE